MPSLRASRDLGRAASLTVNWSHSKCLAGCCFGTLPANEVKNSTMNDAAVSANRVLTDLYLFCCSGDGTAS